MYLLPRDLRNQDLDLVETPNNVMYPLICQSLSYFLGIYASIIHRKPHPNAQYPMYSLRVCTDANPLQMPRLRHERKNWNPRTYSTAVNVPPGFLSPC